MTENRRQLRVLTTTTARGVARALARDVDASAPVKIVAASVLALTSLVTSAHADPAAPHAESTPRARSVPLAVGLSVATTALGLLARAHDQDNHPVYGAVGDVLLALGPSTGRWYAGDTGASMWAPLAVRAADVAYLEHAVRRDMGLEGDHTPAVARRIEIENDLAVGTYLVAAAFDVVLAAHSAATSGRAPESRVMPFAPAGAAPGAGLAFAHTF